MAPVYAPPKKTVSLRDKMAAEAAAAGAAEKAPELQPRLARYYNYGILHSRAFLHPTNRCGNIVRPPSATTKQPEHRQTPSGGRGKRLEATASQAAWPRLPDQPRASPQLGDKTHRCVSCSCELKQEKATPTALTPRSMAGCDAVGSGELQRKQTGPEKERHNSS